MLLQVRATDSGSPSRFSDRSLTINILDVNDNTPIIENHRGYNVSVNEVRCIHKQTGIHNYTHKDTHTHTHICIHHRQTHMPKIDMHTVAYVSLCPVLAIFVLLFMYVYLYVWYVCIYVSGMCVYVSYIRVPVCAL